MGGHLVRTGGSFLLPPCLCLRCDNDQDGHVVPGAGGDDDTGDDQALTLNSHHTLETFPEGIESKT